MLKQLSIRNFTLIDSLDIDFCPGFSVITGETGAGKSIILGAIGLLLGQRADPKAIKNGAAKCVIEAHFDLSRYDLKTFFEQNDLEYDPDDCIIRREVSAAGKSRAFINDTPSPLSLLKELGERLIDVHSQHQNLLLSKQNFQLEVVDIIADDGNILDGYRRAFNAYNATRRELEELEEKIEADKKNADFIKFQYEELSNAALADGEQEELEQLSETMSHSEEIKTALFEADTSLSSDDSGAVNNLRNAANSMQSIGRMMPDAAELAERMSAAYIELKDISEEISRLADNIEFDPAELDKANNRLDKIYSLEKKYHCESVGELLCHQNELKEQLDGIENSDETMGELTEKLARRRQQCLEAAGLLTAARTAAAAKIEQEMAERLAPLGMPNVRFRISIDETEPAPDGCDRVSFLFSANKSTLLQPVAQVASGGEIARVMLSLKAMISGAVKLPTIIFDEIDTGVSGKIAEKMALIMQQMGRNNRQVISITHLPQIAALGQTHYKVYKEDTETGTASHMTRLDEDGRIREIAQMLSGSDITEAAISNAKELLKK